MASKSFNTKAIVLKRVSVGETDRIITLLSPEYGKIVAVAKGVRKLKSSNRATLEPGNIVQAFLIKTKSLPILTQTKMIKDASESRTSLSKIRQLSQILEIFDRLFVEDFIDEEGAYLAYKIHQNLLAENKRNLKIKDQLNQLIQVLGYQDIKDTKHQNILDYVAEITEKKMKSYDYLNYQG